MPVSELVSLELWRYPFRIFWKTDLFSAMLVPSVKNEVGVWQGTKMVSPRYASNTVFAVYVLVCSSPWGKIDKFQFVDLGLERGAVTTMCLGEGKLLVLRREGKFF